MTVPGPSDGESPATAADFPVLGFEPADEHGEQWHGVHSTMQDPREPRRQPGGVQRTVNSDGSGDPHQ
jgi:hypothetical protein